MVLHTNQLESLIRTSLQDMLTTPSDDLSIDSRYLVGYQGSWEVSAEIDDNGSKRQVKLRINPKTGQVSQVIVPNDSEVILEEGRSDE